MTAMRTIVAVTVLILAGAAADAHAWSAGPYSFDRCTKSFKVAVHGKVQSVTRIGTRPGGWVLSRATVGVARTWGLNGKRKQLSFYFWSGTGGMLTIPHKISKGDDLLVFLSRDIKPILNMLSFRGKPVGFFLRFAKANLRGYLFHVVNERGVPTVRDAIFKRNKVTMAVATKLLRRL